MTYVIVLLMIGAKFVGPEKNYLGSDEGIFGYV